MPEYIFSYGTLRESRVQNELFGRRLTGSNDQLKGFRLKDIDIGDPDFLARGEDIGQQTLVASNNSGDSVDGTVFEITFDELLLVDEYEPSEYRRAEVTLASGKEAWVYLAS